MAGNSWQQPVSGEPSLGTPHVHRETLVNEDPATASAQTVTVSTVPTGTTMIAGFARVLSATTAGRTLNILDTAGNIYAMINNPTTGIYGSSAFLVPLDANREFAYSVDNADVSSVRIYLREYFL